MDINCVFFIENIVLMQYNEKRWCFTETFIYSILYKYY